MIRFLGRGVMGTACVWLLANVWQMLSINLPAGINLLTFVCCAFFGLPGVLLVYGLSFIYLYV